MNLIVLVITIIVMIIIVGAIILTVVNTDIINKANKAVEKTNSKLIEEAVKVAYFQTYNEYNRGISNLQTEEGFKSRFIELVGNNGITEEDLNDNGIIVKISGIRYLGNIKSYETCNVNGYVTENVTYNGEEKSYNNPIIPKDFKPVDVGTAVWGENNSFEYGLVVEDKFGNQYVWVPVDGTNVTMNRYVGYMNKNLQTGDYNNIGTNVSGGTTYILTEPLSYGATVAASWELEEHQAMLSSVSQYNGFYIARYEASMDTSSGTRAASKSGPGIYPWANIQWGTGMTTIGTAGAVYYARKMTTDYEYETVVSTLIYGAQYDAALRFIEKYGVKDATYKSDSTNKGWYNNVSGNVVGLTGYYSANNIYDMAGSLYEWTMEAYSSTGRIRRGGSYNGTASYYPASYRYTFASNNKQVFIGFRTAIYIK